MSDERPEPSEIEAAEAAAPVSRPLPGTTLRMAREARNMTVHEVASALKFGPRQIEALEADDFAALPPGATFLRGFVRGYAKLLKLDPVPLVAMLDDRMPAALPDVREPQNMGVAATPVVAGRRSSLPMLAGAAVLGVVVVGLAAMHFLGAPSPAMQKASGDAGGVAAAVRAPEIRVEPAASAAASAPAATQQQAQAATVPMTPDMRQLVFTFQEKSWVEVKDATQRVIFSAESPAGSRQAVVGKPPFQLVVGNAAKVDLQYEDHQVDLKPYTRAEVARLTLE